MVKNLAAHTGHWGAARIYKSFHASSWTVDKMKHSFAVGGFACRVTQIQRVNTLGGAAPKVCPAGVSVAVVPYLADYVFYGGAPTTPSAPAGWSLRQWRN